MTFQVDLACNVKMKTEITIHTFAKWKQYSTSFGAEIT